MQGRGKFPPRNIPKSGNNPRKCGGVGGVHADRDDTSYIRHIKHRRVDLSYMPGLYYVVVASCLLSIVLTII